MKYRIEKDTMGEVKVPHDAHFGELKLNVLLKISQSVELNLLFLLEEVS